MSRVLLMFGVVLFAGCVCVTSLPPTSCSPCGLRMQVFSMRGSGDVLTRAECEKLCDPAWCGARPMGDEPGCSLISSTELICGPAGLGCGATLPRACGPSNCTGCCRADGQCVTDFGSCGGQACSACTAGDRCTSTNCAALAACGARLEAMPRWSACDDVDGGFVPPVESTQDCVDACRASDGGAVVACAASLSACDDAGVAFAAQCASDAGTPFACATDCAATRLRCEEACPLSASEACAACARGCGFSFGTCLRDCP